MTLKPERVNEMRAIASQLEAFLLEHGRRRDIAITYDCLTAEDIRRRYTEFQRTWHGLNAGGEYFFVWEETPEGTHLLYSKDVTSDSAMYAAYELMGLLANKF